MLRQIIGQAALIKAKRSKKTAKKTIKRQKSASTSP
jgi:hypothetical protein